jgi:TBC1 domain family member 15
MLLVWYKREFEWSDILRLWEGLWTDYLSSQFHLFIAVSILEKHRDVIMNHLKHFDEVLKYVNELSGTIDLGSTLVRAEGLFRRFEKTVEAVDRKSHFPAPGGARQRKVQGKSINAGGARPKPAAASSSTSADAAGTGQIGAAVAKGVGVEKEQVISPELRVLLSRRVLVLEQQQQEEEEERREGAASGSGSAR